MSFYGKGNFIPFATLSDRRIYLAYIVASIYTKYICKD